MSDYGNRNIFVIGGSAGSITSLRAIFSQIKADFEGTILVAIHLHPHLRSHLDRVLAEKSEIPIELATHGKTLEKGKAYLCVPNRHILVDEEKIILTNGPRENRVKPAIDPLFRSAAFYHRSKTTGIILSGTLDDGSAGLLAVKDCGGLSIVEDPETAQFKEMPKNAKAIASIDHIASPEEIGQLIYEISRSPAPAPPKHIPENLEAEVKISIRSQSDIDLQNELGNQVPYICPECSGPLWEMKEKRQKRYRCHTGHAYSLKNLAAGQEEALEESLWAALRTLEEKARTLKTISKEAKRELDDDMATHYEHQSESLYQQTEHLRNFLLDFENRFGKDPVLEQEAGE